MALQAKLDAYKAAFVKKAPPRVLEIMQRAETELRSSVIPGRIPQVGTKAPDFTLQNVRGTEIRSSELRAQGPLVLGFYRGKW